MSGSPCGVPDIVCLIPGQVEELLRLIRRHRGIRRLRNALLEHLPLGILVEMLEIDKFPLIMLRIHLNCTKNEKLTISPLGHCILMLFNNTHNLPSEY